jgi:Amt family ammonium transporter
MSTALRRLVTGLAPLAALLVAGTAMAEGPESGLNSGDVAWILTSSAIVLMMTIPGLALFYGGLVRSKNVLSVLMHCFICAGLISVTWVLWGYSIAFGGEGPLWGGLAKLGLAGVSMEAGPDENIPEMLFMVFQLMFAIITPALICGAVAERMKFSAFFLFVLLWSTLIYSPLCHWVWGDGGWLAERGALDFAGGTVVHISSGVSALVAAIMLGKRKNSAPPHNLPYTVVGAGMLWVGWFGFNAGSALAVDGTAIIAFVNTNTATGAALLGWLFTEWISRGNPTALGAATGAVAGLVAITPAAGFVSPLGSIVIGLVAGFLCYQACNLKHRFGYDDALDVVGVHGVGGTWGALATGVLAVEAIGGTAGSAGQLFEQGVGVLATYAFAGIGTFAILTLVKAVTGLRVDEEEESSGLDLSEHSETAYIH